MADANVGACAALARRHLPLEDAELLLCDALALPRSHLYAFPERAVSVSAATRLDDWVRRRRRGEPVAYITGRRGFWGLDLEVSAHTLIPRPDTETLVEVALGLTSAQANVLDIGTGCGAVALALASERPTARVVATDIDPRCVSLCRRNASRLGLAVDAQVADGFDGIDERFDVVVSNPPYVAAQDAHLRQGDLRYEPRLALVGGDDGLRFLARLARQVPANLAPDGWLCLEHGCKQAAEVQKLLLTNGFRDVRTCPDIEGRARVTFGRNGGASA